MFGKLSKKIGSRLTAYYPRDVVESVCVNFPKRELCCVIDNLEHDWTTHVYQEDEDKNYSDLVTILIINMIGKLNRVKMRDIEGKSKLIYIYLTSLERMLSYKSMKNRFLSCSYDLMGYKAA